MSTSNQHTLADSGANERTSMLERGNYIPWKSRFKRFLDNKLEDGERMWNSIQNGPYERLVIPNPDNTQQQILEPLSKMTTGNKNQYIADVKVMIYVLQAILNDIYNLVDACLEVDSIRHIQGVRYDVLEFLGVRTMFDIFQNLYILYLQYGVLIFSGYGVLSLFPLWYLVSAGTDTPYLP
ncbi:hypothetical protein Tco_1329240 [Tanacetum coccineum]